MGVKERLLNFLDYKGIRKATFEKECGLSNGYISRFKGNIGADKLEGILSRYPDLSRSWLLTGEGEMLSAGSTNTGNITAHDDSEKLKEKCALLERIIKEKETIIQEKERLIQLLLNKLN